ncbi:gustatory receptor for sugar taste 43a [Condylostylus longicornis]|uniref:gustatory receptor for sugar taste 43a n=1 Tax=Condylostylus longicornis TaxID=2530218 RepID=UPI00244DBB7C|nr:gustatory receptor for sugar taste 43a [Condylostylus longicornis]
MEISKHTIGIFYTARIFGLAPYTLKKKGTVQLEVMRSKIFTVYSLILISTMVCLTYRGLLFDASSNMPVRMKSNTSKVVTALDVSVVVLSTLSGVACGINGVTSTQDLNADEILTGHDAHFKEQKRAYIMLGVSMFTISLMLGLDVWTWNSKARQMNLSADADANIIWYVPFYSLYFILVALHLHFANSGFVLANRYKRLNSLLKTEFLNTDDKSEKLEKLKECFKERKLNIYDDIYNNKPLSKGIPKKHSLTIPSSTTYKIRTVTKAFYTFFILEKTLIQIDRIAYIHESLSKGVHSISSAFGVTVVFMLVSCLLHLVATAYFLFLELIERHPKFSYLQFLWIAFHCIRLLLIVEPCHVTTAEAKKTIQIVCEIDRNCHNPLIASSLKKFWQQLLADKPYFSACGMCNIDRQLLTSFSSAICTYLVILIQFQGANG